MDRRTGIYPGVVSRAELWARRWRKCADQGVEVSPGLGKCVRITDPDAGKAGLEVGADIHARWTRKRGSVAREGWFAQGGHGQSVRGWCNQGQPQAARAVVAPPTQTLIGVPWRLQDDQFFCASTALRILPNSSSAWAEFSQRTMTTILRSGSTQVKELPAPTPK